VGKCESEGIRWRGNCPGPKLGEFIDQILLTQLTDEMDVKVIELPQFDRKYHFLLVVYSSNISILHQFQDMTISTVYR